MSKLLVTGAAGFIGANFIHYWHSANPDDTLVALDCLTYAGNRNNLHGALGADWFTFVEGSITDQALVETLLREHAIDTLVHFAAESHVDRSITGPDAFIDTNIVGTHTLLKAAKACWLESDLTRNNLFHHVSTDEVYGTLSANDPAFSETTPTRRIRPMLRAKRRAIILCALTTTPSDYESPLATARTITALSSFRKNFCRCAC